MHMIISTQDVFTRLGNAEEPVLQPQNLFSKLSATTTCCFSTAIPLLMPLDESNTIMEESDIEVKLALTVLVTTIDAPRHF